MLCCQIFTFYFMLASVQSRPLLISCIRKDSVDIARAFGFLQSGDIEVLPVFQILCYWYPSLLLTNLLHKNFLKIRSRNENYHSLNVYLLSTHLWVGLSHPVQASVSHWGLTSSLLTGLPVSIFAPFMVCSLQQPEWSFKNFLSVLSLPLLSTL